MLREGTAHFRTHTTHAPGFPFTIDRNHASRNQALKNEGAIPLVVEFRVSRHQSNRHLLRSRFDDRGQTRAVVPRKALGALRQQDLLIQVRHDHPTQPMPPGQWLFPIMMCAGQYTALASGEGVADPGADAEPERVAAEASQKAAAFRGGDGGVAFAGERGDFRGVVGGILLRDGELGLAGAAVLNVVEERLQIGGGNLRGGRGRQGCG